MNLVDYSKPLFSIIMPCYNSERYVDKAIQSCLDQVYQNWQLVIVNDGSTDKTIEIINSYAKTDRRISIFNKENGGYVSAVNFGLKHIRGEYFMLLGSDDELYPSLLFEVYSHLSHSNPSDMIGFKTTICTVDKTLVQDKNSDFNSVVWENNTDVKSFSDRYPNHSKIFFTRDTSKLYKTELLQSLRYFGEKGMDADGIFSMLFAHKSTSFLCIPIRGYLWNLRSESLSGRKKDYQTQKDRINNWIQFGDEIMRMPECKITSHEKNYLLNYFFTIVRTSFFNFHSDFSRDNTFDICQLFLNKVIEFFGISKIPFEIELFLKHSSLWRCYVIPKICIEKIQKRYKKYVSHFIKKDSK